MSTFSMFTLGSFPQTAINKQKIWRHIQAADNNCRRRGWPVYIPVDLPVDEHHLNTLMTCGRCAVDCGILRTKSFSCCSFGQNEFASLWGWTGLGFNASVTYLMGTQIFICKCLFVSYVYIRVKFMILLKETLKDFWNGVWWFVCLDSFNSSTYLAFCDLNQHFTIFFRLVNILSFNDWVNESITSEKDIFYYCRVKNWVLDYQF